VRPATLALSVWGEGLVVVCVRNCAAGYLGRGVTELASAKPNDPTKVVEADVQRSKALVEKLLVRSC